MIKVKDKKIRCALILFILPALLIYIVFQIIPLIAAVYFSVMDWNGVAGIEMSFVGIKNYISVFQNSDFILALKNMVRFTLLSVAFHTPVALLLAVAINTKCRGYRLFKAVFFIPTVFPLTAVGLMWYLILMPTGSFNALLDMIGLENISQAWLVNPGTAMNTIAFVNIWVGIGYYMVILLAGLTTIPSDVFEAASIDGASKTRIFFQITIPLLKPVMSMCLVMDIIGTVKIFDLVFVMTGGGPNGLTNLPTTLLYNEAFKYSHYGEGSAIGIIILLICLFGTLFSNFVTGRNKE